MGRAPKSSLLPGVYERPGSKNFWLRYTVGKRQIRTSLGTSDKLQAMKNAERILSGASKAPPDPWHLAVNKYIARKLAEGIFTENTAATVGYALRCFHKFASPSDPTDITSEALKEFYENLRLPKNRLRTKEYSEGTVQGYVTKVATFALANKIEVETPRFKGEATGLKNPIGIGEQNRLIDEAPNFTLKAILHFGFFCGLRKDEIVHIRPSWINLVGERMTIPGKEGTWQTKSKRSRVIPLRAKTVNFLKATRDKWEREKYVIEATANGKRYRYDFRRPFTEYMTAQGYEDASPHLMRHSYATFLAENNISPIMIASWTGDRIKTVEKHYLHLHAASSELINKAYGDTVSEEQKTLYRMDQKLDVLIDKKQSLARIDGKELPKPWALLALEKDGEVKDPKLLEVLHKKISEISEEYATAHVLAKMSPEDRLKFYEENDIDPNEPILEGESFEGDTESTSGIVLLDD